MKANRIISCFRQRGKTLSYLLSAFFAVVGMRAFALETAGSLIVKLDMSNLSTTTDGAYIGLWTNQATGDDAVGNFEPCTAGKGAKYVADAGGRPGVYFGGSGDYAMECASELPATVIGSGDWSAEAWIYTPTLLASKTYFTWTRRGGGNQLVEMRYGTDGGNAIEHHSNNIGWGGTIPPANDWHHIAITRDASGNENLYVDGFRVNGKDNYTALNIRDNGLFTLGGTKADNGNFDGGLLYTGYIGAIRVHSGTLTAAQVLANYNEEKESYKRIWNGGTDTWDTASEWTSGGVPGNTSSVLFSKGGTATIDGTDVAIKSVNLEDGTLVVDNGGSLAINGESNINLAKGTAATNGVLWIKNGSFAPNRRVDGAESGGNLVMRFGEPDAAPGTATAVFPNEFHLSVNGTAELIIEDGADITTKNWFTAARYNTTAVGRITMNGGMVTCGNWLLIACEKGKGEFVMNGGHLLANGVEFTYNGDDAGQYGRLYLNGGVFEINYMQNKNPTGEQSIYFNGGILRARRTEGNFVLNNMDLCEVQRGGAIFDVPDAAWAVDVASPFTVKADDPGDIVKIGPGRVNFKDNFSFDGAVDIREGQLKFTTLANLSSVTSIKLAEGTGILCTEAGGMAALLAKITTDSRGTLLIASQNENENIDLSGHPYLSAGPANDNVNYKGTITWAQGVTPSYAYHSGFSIINVNKVLADDGNTPMSLKAYGPAYRTDRKIVLKQNNTLTGGILVDGVMLQSDVAQGFGTIGPITLKNGGSLVFNQADIDVQGVINRITADSVGHLIFCSNSKKDVNFSLVGHPGLYVGAYSGHSFDYLGTITPDNAAEWHFGGGGAPYTQNDGGFKYKPSASSIEDVDANTPTKVVLNGLGINGLFKQSGFTGGFVVTNNAALYFWGSYDASWGSAPVEKADFFYFDNGNIRQGSSSTSLPANKGMTIGPGGMKIHVWGSQSLTVNGSLHGTGPIQITDSGTFVLGGAANDYTGTITVNDKARLQIGTDTAFNWDFVASTPHLMSAGYLIVHMPANQNVTASVPMTTGQGYFWKEGAGTLEIAAKQNWTATRIVAGTLAIDGDDFIATSGLTMEAGSVLEIRNNATLHLDALNGEGTITAPQGTTATIVLGSLNGDGSFTGTIAENVLIVKEGTGRAELVLSANRGEATVNAGTLALTLPSTIGRPVVAAGATLELTSAESGTSVSITDTSAVAGTIVLGEYTSYVYNVTEGTTNSNPVVILPTDADATVAKAGAGTLEWSARGEDAILGTFAVQEGTLALKEATAVGSLDIGEDATVSVSPKKNPDYRGLSLRYYDYDKNNGYSAWHSLTDIHRMFEEDYQPTIVTNTWVFGSPTFETDANPAYREPGKYSTGRDNYQVYATGRIYLPYDGEYEIGFTSDDGCFLYIDGEKRFANSGVLNTNTGWMKLSAGFHDIEWAFCEQSGGQYFHVSIWARQKEDVYFDKWTAWTPIPQDILYPEFSRVAGLSGSGTLAIGEGMLVVHQAALSSFNGTVTASATGYLVKRGAGTLALTGAVAANVVSGEGTLALAPVADDAAYANVVAEEGATVVVDASGAVSVARLRGRGTLVVDGGAVVTADADGFEGTVRVVNGKFLAAEVMSDSKMSKYTVITDPSENATALAGIAGTPSGEAVPYADLAAPDAAVEVVGANAVVMGADSVALGDGADVTLAALEKQEVGDYGLWQINGTADKWAGIDGETGFLMLNGGTDKVGSAYLKEKFNVTQPWRMTWTFVATKGAGNAWGDGVCFTIQNDAAGAGLCDTACNGGKLGGPCDTTHPLSAAFWWNLYQKESCGWALKGVKEPETETVLLNSPTDAERRTIQGYDLDISYNGAGVMSCRIFYQGEQVYASTQAIDMADVIGGGDENWDGTAYVGFSAASGGSGAFMSVRNVAWHERTYRQWDVADTTYSDSLWQANGTVSTDDNGIKMCVGSVGNMCSSIYMKEKRDIRGKWKAHWAFKAVKGSFGGYWGDGVCFALQDDQAGAALCDGTGGELGGPCKSSHARSIAFWWNLYQKESCGWALKGVKGTETVLLNNPNDAQRRTPNGYALDIEHNGAGTLTCTITYGGEQVYSQSQTVDFADVFGSGWDGKAYFGFSAGMGGSSSDLWVKDISWSDRAEQTRNPRQAVSVMADAEAALSGTIGGESLGALTLNGGSSLEIKPSAVVPANANYTVAADELRLTGGASTLSIAANGTGSGTLVVERIVYDGGTVSVSGGNIAVPAASGGVLEVVVADPEFKSRVTLVQFSDGASLNGVTATVVKDADGKILGAKAYVQNGNLVLSMQRGFSVIVR